MRKNSSIWSSTRLQAGLPNDLLVPMKSDIFYTNLMYGVDCLVSVVARSLDGFFVDHRSH